MVTVCIPHFISKIIYNPQPKQKLVDIGSKFSPGLEVCIYPLNFVITLFLLKIYVLEFFQIRTRFVVKEARNHQYPSKLIL
jgi:hypothetical protein